MQYCPNCKVQIRGIKARCPLCQRELQPAAHRMAGPAPDSQNPEAEEAEIILPDDDPFVYLPAPKVSFMFMVRVIAFLCVSLEIIFGAAQIITGFRSGWIFASMLIVLLVWGDFMIAAYYRNNLIRMLTTQAYIIMAVCLVIAAWTGSGSWAVSFAVPGLFCLLVIVTFAAARGQKMHLQEFILYPAFDLLMCLLQIIPIALGRNPVIAPAVISIALMLILVSSLVIFRGRMLQEAAVKYMHM